MLKGKIIGAVLGGLAGGPLGAVFGLASGHMYDEQRGGSREEFIEAISVGIIKTARLDGSITEAKILEAERVLKELNFNAEMKKRVAVHFKRAKASAENLDSAAARFAKMFAFPQQRKLYFMVMLRIAAAGGAITPEKRAALSRVARILDIDASEFPGFTGSAARERPNISALERAYEVLGVSKNAGDEEIRKIYRAKCKELHPDIIRSKGVGDFAVKALEDELIRVKDAYETIKKHRS